MDTKELLQSYTEFLTNRYNILGVPGIDQTIDDFLARLPEDSQTSPPYFPQQRGVTTRPRRKRGLDNETTDRNDW